MARGEQPICKGQVLAVIALRLAFQPYAEACRILGIGPARMRRYLAPEWTVRGAPRSKWSGDILLALERAWRAKLPLQEISDDYGIDVGVLRKVAVLHGWPHRTSGRPLDPLSGRSMSPERRRYFTKLRRSGVPVAEAKATAWAAAFGNSDVPITSPGPRNVASLPLSEASAGSSPMGAAPERV